MRKEKNLSQEQVADYLHTSQSTYARMESGKSNSWAIYLVAISELFEIQPEDLICQNLTKTNHTKKNENAIQVHQLSEKLITQFEKRIADKEAMIQLLQKTNSRLLELVERLKR